MLHFRSHWHFAFERDPFGEARLLWFAGANIPGVPDPLNEAKESGESDPAVARAIDDAQAGVRAQTGAALAGDDTLVRAAPSAEELRIAEEKRKNEEADAAVREENERKKKESMRMKMNQVQKEIREEMEQMKKLKKRMESAALLERLKSYGSKELNERWMRDIETLEREEQNSTRELQFATAMQSFWEGEISPQAFMLEHGDYMRNLPYGFDLMGKQISEGTSDVIDSVNAMQSNNGSPDLIDNVAVPVSNDGKFAESNASDRILKIQSIRDIIQMDDWMADQASMRRKVKQLLTAKEKWVEGIEKQSDAILAAEQAPDTGGLTKALMSIRFYSLNNYIHGIQKYWAALKSTLEQRNERYDADIARSIGRSMKYFNFWPIYGEEVDIILDQQLDAKSDEESKGIVDQLEKKNARWADLFSEPDGEFWKWTKGKINANKARGVLEYATKHGFLYEIDENFADPDMRIYGIPLREICEDWHKAGEEQKIVNYFSSLRSKNASGRESEMKSGKETVEEIGDVPQFIKLINAELDDNNLWTTAGICKRAMERGLLGEVSPWLLTTIMDKLRQKPELRKRTPSIFYDIIGKLSMYNTAFTLGWAKGYRRELRDWSVTGNEEVLETTEIRYFKIIADDIKAKDPSTDYDSDDGRQKMNRLVAQVLACQVVELPNGYVHIYQDKFDTYRSGASEMFAATADPHKEDTDYAIATTEKAMLPLSAYDDILSYTSTREFENKKWVEPFFTSIIRTAKELKRIPQLRDAHKNYCKEVAEKMDKHFKALHEEPFANKQLHAVGMGKPAIAHLIVEGLLNWENLKNAKWAGELEEQLRTDPDFVGYWEKNIAVNGLPATKKPKTGGTKSE